MAMFDDDMVTVTTPDGRQIPMPSSLAASFPALQVQQSTPPPPAAQPALAAAPVVPQPAVAPPPPPPPAPPATEPPRSGPVTSPGDEQGNQPVAADRRQPVTNKQLAAEGPAGVLEAQNKALDQEQAAIHREAELQADEAAKEGARMAQRDAEAQAINAERAKAARAELDERAMLMAKRNALADEIAKTKIDRSVDHPIWSTIGLILSTIGTAMKTRPGEKWENPAYDTLMQQIDRKVDAQMKDLDLKRASLQQMNAGITEQRQLGMDRLAEIDVRKDAALQQAKMAVETMAQQFKSPLAKIQAMKLGAKIDQDRATLAGQAEEKIRAQQNADRAIRLQERGQAIQLRGQDLEQNRFERQLAATEREKMAAISAKILEEKTKASAEKRKSAKELGIADPRTGLPMLNPEGQARVAQADQLEAQARKDPGAAGMAAIQEMKKQATTQDELDQLRAVEARVRMDPQSGATIAKQYAQSVRDDALANNAETARDPKTAEKLSEELGSAQALTVFIGDVTDMLKAGPSAFNRAKWSSIKTELSNIAGRYASALGERPSVKALQQNIEHIENYDPDSIFDRVASREKAIESLNKLRQMVAVTTDASLKSNFIRSGWTPKTLGEGAVGFNASEKTAAEEAASATPGWLDQSKPMVQSKTIDQYRDALAGVDRKAEFDAASSRRVSEPGKFAVSEAGLSPNTTFALKAMIKRADSAGDKERADIINSLRAPIEAGLQEGGRESLSYGMLNVISAQDPQLFRELVGGMSDFAQEAISKAGVGSLSDIKSIPGKLPPSGFNPDKQAAASEAARKRDEDAAIAEYVRQHPIKGKPDIEALLRYLNPQMERR